MNAIKLIPGITNISNDSFGFRYKESLYITSNINLEIGISLSLYPWTYLIIMYMDNIKNTNEITNDIIERYEKNSIICHNTPFLFFGSLISIPIMYIFNTSNKQI